jgi:hypothetical protein
MTNAERYRLLHSPYTAPPLKPGERTSCLYRGAEVVITSWSAARIPWLRCRAIDVRGGSDLLINEELLRAIRMESAEAIKYWSGVSTKAVWNWRKAFGIGRLEPEGSRRLQMASSQAGANKTRGKRLPASTVKRMSATRRARGRKPTGRWAKDGWKPEQLALLGTMADAKLAECLGRSANAVRVKRTRLGIPAPVTSD